MNQTACVLYVLFDIICGVGLWYFYYNIKKYADKKTSITFFMLSLLLASLVAFNDVIYALRETGIINYGDFVNNITEIGYILPTMWGAYCWFVYSELEQKSFTMRTKILRVLFSIPIIVMTVVVLTNGYHHLYFNFTDGKYERGVLNIPFTVIIGLYVVKSGVFALVKSFKSKFYTSRRLYRELFVYTASFLTAQLLQSLFGSPIPFMPICALIVYYMAQDRILKSNVFIDKLSGINNRTALEQYLQNHFPKADESFYYIIFDMDNFKHINDSYGHNAGDKAIQYMATALKKSAVSGVMIARYGGDEFVMMGKFENEDAVKALIDSTREKLKHILEKENVPYTMGTSAGYCNKYNEDMMIPDLLAKADAAMYRNKQERKAKGIV